ncbi:MAG: hypothetical protein ACJ8CN_10030 [Gemmatimonadales bacterium]
MRRQVAVIAATGGAPSHAHGRPAITGNNDTQTSGVPAGAAERLETRRQWHGVVRLR